jgi:type I pantothenate kinase
LIPEGFDPPPEYVVVDRATWARRASEPMSMPMARSAVDETEWREIYVPLGDLVRPMIGDRPLLVAVAGSVAAGKSTFAAALASLFDSARVISTDSFLLPNSVLGRRAGFKGFPDTYDHQLFADTLRRLAAGETVTIPRYSHEVYDIAGDQVVEPAAVVIVEGINALQSHGALGIYLDAREPDVRSWYVTRFLALIDEARHDPSSFFAQWTGLSPVDAAALATTVWETVNLVNLEENILPTRWHADLVLRKDINHHVQAIARR